MIISVMHSFRICTSIVFLVVLTSCTYRVNEQTLYGNWEGSFNNQKLNVVFQSENSFEFNYLDKQSKILTTISGNYELDLSKRPVPLTVRNIPQLSHQLHTVIELVGEDSMRMALFSPKWRLRPISFEPGKTIILKRSSNK